MIALLIYTGLIGLAVLAGLVLAFTQELEPPKKFEASKVLYVVPDGKALNKKMKQYLNAFEGELLPIINRGNSTVDFGDEIFYIRAASNPDHLRGFSVDRIVVQDCRLIDDYEEIKRCILIPSVMRSGGDIVEL